MSREEQQLQAFLDAVAADPYDETNHKVFADWLEEHGMDDEAAVQRRWTADLMRAAERYVRGTASSFGVPYDTLLAKAALWLDTGETIHVDELHAYDSDPEFWAHFEILTGRPVPLTRRDESFTHCAC